MVLVVVVVDGFLFLFYELQMKLYLPCWQSSEPPLHEQKRILSHMATNLRWNSLVAPLPATARPSKFIKSPRLAHQLVFGMQVQAFRRSDIDGFAKRMASGDALRDAWRTANDGFERFLFEAKKTSERLDRRYSVSTRLDSVARVAVSRVHEIDRELEIGSRWRAFSMDFSRNWPMVCYRKSSLYRFSWLMFIPGIWYAYWRVALFT